MYPFIVLSMFFIYIYKYNLLFIRLPFYWHYSWFDYESNARNSERGDGRRTEERTCLNESSRNKMQATRIVHLHDDSPCVFDMSLESFTRRTLYIVLVSHRKC